MSAFSFGFSGGLCCPYWKRSPFCFRAGTTTWLGVILLSFFPFLRMLCLSIVLWHWVLLRRGLRSPCRRLPRPRCLKYLFSILEIEKQNQAVLAGAFCPRFPEPSVCFPRTDSVLSFQGSLSWVLSPKPSPGLYPALPPSGSPPSLLQRPPQFPFRCTHCTHLVLASCLLSDYFHHCAFSSLPSLRSLQALPLLLILVSALSLVLAVSN